MNKIISAVNWKNAVGEILLIVIGISVALTMDSWWEESKAHKDEISLLSQTLVTLRVDSEVLKERLSELRDRAHMFTELRQHVENQLPYTDELAPKFRLMTYWQTTGINTAPYEALKARGLDLISDQDLRLKLINYFDREVPRLEDRDAIDRIQTLEIFQPYFRTRFEWGTYTSRLRRADSRLGVSLHLGS